MTSSEGRGDEQYGHLSDAQLDLYDRMSEISEDRKRGGRQPRKLTQPLHELGASLPPRINLPVAPTIPA